MGELLKLYEINDNADGNLDWEETTWAAIWAADESEARSIYREHLRRESGLSSEECDGVSIVVEERGSTFAAPRTPQIERRDIVLRQLGWRYEDESPCDGCDLYAMDIDEYVVCPECNQCPECGHLDDCPDREVAESVHTKEGSEA